jgi:hypothetical protein
LIIHTLYLIGIYRQKLDSDPKEKKSSEHSMILGLNLIYGCICGVDSMVACLKIRFLQNLPLFFTLLLTLQLPLTGCKSVDTPPNLTEHEQNLKQTQTIKCFDETDLEKKEPLQTEVINPIAFYPMGITASGSDIVYTEQLKSRILSFNGSENSELWSLTGCGP